MTEQGREERLQRDGSGEVAGQEGDRGRDDKIYSFSDNLRYGIKFAKKFIDAPDKRLLKKTGEIRNLMNLHNNEAGRRVSLHGLIMFTLTNIHQAIARLMLMKCRCHGVSGSCEFKTCWKSLPQFAEIGKYLKYKYDKSAVKVRHGCGY